VSGAAYRRCADALAQAPKTWLLTGAAGFIGSHLAAELLRLGQRVVGLDNFSSGSRQNLELVQHDVGAAAFARFTLIEADICELPACTRAAHGADYVIHQAAVGSVPRSIERPLDTHRTNVDGTLHVFLAALEQRVPRVVYASSSSVYGDEPTLPKVEERIGRPLSPYAASKRFGELYADVLGRTHGLSAIGLRYFNVVGARQDPAGPYAAVIPRWVDALSRGEQPVLFGDGETTRDFCPVRNVVEANILAASTASDLRGRVYNVALGGQTSLNQLFALLRDGMAERGFPCAGMQPSYQPFRAGDIRHSLADVSAAVRDLEYAPVHGLREGLGEVMDFFARRR
jgi:UDP-N-acetylglucosamine 4-epimerase